VHPLRGVLPLQVLEGGLGVVDLVEHFFGRESEPRQPEDRGHEQEGEGDGTIATGAGRDREELHGAGV
jgi:hypothetical protein